MQEARYKAFISYSHRDERWAKWLHRSLETYKPPSRLVGTTTAHGVIPSRLSPIFRDREELPSAVDLGMLINEALHNSACLVVICSPASARSRWVNEEIIAFKRLGRSDRIFSLIVAGEPNATDMEGRADEECFPPALRFQLDSSGALSEQRTEPIAADVRDGKDGRLNAKIKLIAGMLGVGFDALRQRELRRTQRRLALIATGAAAGMVLTSGLAVSAWLTRIEAEKQRNRAQLESETSRQVTNFLVGLFKVSDPSESLGNSITAREILDRGARRIEYELGNQPEVRATLLDTVGTVYASLGLYDQANQLLGQALSTRRRLFGERHELVAHSEANMGQVLGQQAKYDEAAHKYDAAIAILRADPVASAELARALNGLANVRSGHGDNVTAEKLLREAIGIERRIGNGESTDLARSLDDLGLVLTYQARYADAEPVLRESVALFRKLIPSGVHPDLSSSINDLALFLYEAGRYGEAEKLWREALGINTRLLGDKHPTVAVSLNNLAFVLQDSGKLAEAEVYLRRALDICVTALGEKHPRTAQSLNNLAFLYHDQGNTALALDYSRRALAIYRGAYHGDHTDVAHALESLGQWLVEAGDYRAAGPLLEEALAINQRLLPNGHTDIAIAQSHMALYLLRTGHASEALEQATSADASLTNGLGAEHWRTAWARNLRGAAFTALSRYREAEPLVLQSYDRLRKASGVGRTQVELARSNVEHLYTAWGRASDASRYRALTTVAAAASAKPSAQELTN